jgi:hypothetical protein
VSCTQIWQEQNKKNKTKKTQWHWLESWYIITYYNTILIFAH